MHSYEVLRDAAEVVGVKALAGELKISPALVYKWCQPSDPHDPEASGARNPLDRLSEIVRVTGSMDVVNWACQQADGFFVTNPKPRENPHEIELLSETQRLVKEFGDLLLTVTKSIQDDGFIEDYEAERIRRSWERLKGTGESFTTACERGIFSADGEQPSPS